MRLTGSFQTITFQFFSKAFSTFSCVFSSISGSVSVSIAWNVFEIPPRPTYRKDRRIERISFSVVGRGLGFENLLNLLTASHEPRQERVPDELSHPSPRPSPR